MMIIIKLDEYDTLNYEEFIWISCSLFMFVFAYQTIALCYNNTLIANNPALFK